MLTYRDIRPIADELFARWDRMDPATRDPNYEAGVYDLAREYVNKLVEAGESEELIRASSPAEIIARHDALDDE